jgi:uncharacterized protein (UPF0335 family)
VGKDEGKPETDVNGVSGKRLIAYIERIERLEEEKKGISDDIKDVKAEAKAFGFDVPTINTIVKLRKLTTEQRAEAEALLDIYKAALGMLFDTPLGEAARRRLSEPRPTGRPDDADEGEPDPSSEEQGPAPVDLFEGVSVDDARSMGTEAATGGVPVTKNPFPASDSRRAAWDEAWCSALGSDGMDIPEPFRRKKAEKPDDAPSSGQAQ